MESLLAWPALLLGQLKIVVETESPKLDVFFSDSQCRAPDSRDTLVDFQLKIIAFDYFPTPTVKDATAVENNQPSPGIVDGGPAVHIWGSGVSSVHHKQLGLEDLSCLGRYMQRCGPLLLQKREFCSNTTYAYRHSYYI